MSFFFSFFFFSYYCIARIILREPADNDVWNKLKVNINNR